MASVTEHVVTAATWEYVTAEGKRRRAFFGDAVLLTDEEAERGFAVGALGVELPAESTDDESDSAEADVTGGGDDPDEGAATGSTGDGGDGNPDSTAEESGDEGEGASTDGDNGTEGAAPRDKPLKAATKPVLVDWLMANGTYDRGELEDQDKADLWALIEATD